MGNPHRQIDKEQGQWCSISNSHPSLQRQHHQTQRRQRQNGQNPQSGCRCQCTKGKSREKDQNNQLICHHYLFNQLYDCEQTYSLNINNVNILSNDNYDDDPFENEQQHNSQLRKVPRKSEYYIPKQPRIMQTLYELVYKLMAPYILLSGKMPDDLGYPSQCAQNPQYSYFTAKTLLEENGSQYTIYYGFCFSNSCTVNDLNQNGAAVINLIINDDVFSTQNTQFYQPSFENEITAGAIVMYCILAILIVVCMIWSGMKWLKQCLQEESNVYEIDLEESSQEMTNEREVSVIEKISIEAKWKILRTEQENKKIYIFSLFKILAVPWMMYGALFYLGNLGAFNILAFKSQIYKSFYSRVALFAYYLPDIFFFISGFLFARKIFSLDEYKQQKHKFIIRAFLKKIVRLYPLYIITIFIYWFITPTLHSGPLWFNYQSNANQCNTAWWRVLLLIDNWFSQGCYSPAWFVQAQLQLVFISCIFFFVYIFRRIIGIVSLVVWTIAMWVLLFVINSKLPVSLEITTQNYTQLYFRSTYSHAPFYFFGALTALISQKQSVRSVVNTYFIEKTSFLSISNIVATAIIVLVMMKPSVWQQGALQIQLALCRLGVFLGFLILFIPSIFKESMQSTSIHKYAYYVYPVLLVSGFVTMSSFWSSETFPYISGFNLLTAVVPNLMISILIGILLGLMFDFRTFKIKIG